MICATITNAVAIAQWALNAAFWASPVGLVVLGVAALIAIGVLLWKNWDSIVGFFKWAWVSIKEWAINAFNGLCDFFIKYWPYILGVFTGGIGLIIGLVIQNWDSIKAKTIEIWDGIKEVFANLWDGIKETFTKGIDKIKELWNALKEFLKNPIKGVVKLFKKTDEDGAGSVDGSFAGGLPNVPFNGFIARLHAGERVLTANENKNYGNAQVAPTTTTHNDVKIYVNASDRTADEVVNEIMPKLKLAIQNL